MVVGMDRLYRSGLHPSAFIETGICCGYSPLRNRMGPLDNEIVTCHLGKNKVQEGNETLGEMHEIV